MRLVDIDRVPVADELQEFANPCVVQLPRWAIEEIVRTCSAFPNIFPCVEGRGGNGERRKKMTNDLISRKKAINATWKEPSYTDPRQGCWMTKDYEYGTDGEEDRWVERIALEGDYAYCSQCGGEILLDGGEDYVYSAYCPHCGTKMKEVTNDDER